MTYEIGDMERVWQQYEADWPEAQGRVGVIVGHAMRLHIPAAKVMVLGEVAEFDLTELEKVCK